MTEKIELTENELQEKINDAVADAIAEKEESFSKEKGKLSQEAAKWRRIAQGKDNSEDQSQIESLSADNEKLQAELSKVQKELKTVTKNAEAATKSLESEQNFTQSLLVDNGLVSELTKAGVTNPAHLKAASSMLKSQVQIVQDGENRIAKVGDKELSEYVKEWAGGDEGKHFVAAPSNSGGGASGDDGKGGGGKTVTRSAFDSMSQAERSTFSKEGGKVIDG